MYSQVLAERVRELKETQEGVDHMCQEMEKIYREGRKEGREAGRLEGKREICILGAFTREQLRAGEGVEALMGRDLAQALEMA